MRLPGDKGYVNVSRDDHRLKQHSSYSDAMEEATRLAQKLRQPIVLYGPLAVVKPPRGPTIAEIFRPTGGEDGSMSGFPNFEMPADCASPDC